MKILLTGSQGFTGHHFYKYLEDLGHDVIGVDKVDNGYKQKLLKIDLTKKSFEGNADIIFHLASNVGGIRYLDTEGFNIASQNIIIDLNVIYHCIKYRKPLVYFSSSCVYDTNLYGKEKMFAENLIKASGIDYLIVRPQNIYGTEDNKQDKRKQVIMCFFEQSKKDEITLLGTGKEKRNFIWTTDLFNLIMNNIGINRTIDAGGEWITMEKLANKIKRLTNSKAKIVRRNNKETVRKYIKFSKPKISIDKRLEEIHKWIKSQ